MKKTILLSLALLSLAFASTVAEAQNPTATPMTVSDTIRNTTATTATIKQPFVLSQYAIQVVITKVSGTVAGTAKFYGSLDGVNYNKVATDTLALTNTTTNSYIWAPGAAKYLYYRITVVGVGTMKATMKGYFLGKN